MREKACGCHFMGYSFQLAANIVYVHHPIQDSTYHSFVTQLVEHWLG